MHMHGKTVKRLNGFTVLRRTGRLSLDHEWFAAFRLCVPPGRTALGAMG